MADHLSRIAGSCNTSTERERTIPIAMSRRHHLTLTVLVVVVIFLSTTYVYTGVPSMAARSPAPQRPAQAPLGHDKPTPSATDAAAPPAKPKPTAFDVNVDDVPSMTETESIAPKLENATLKAELGRATWKFLHTMVARFPEKPTASDRMTLQTFWGAFGMLYPCGDCARHFRQMLRKFPPQTSSRNAAAGWLCSVHNVVNKRLGKEEFDCTKIGDFYDCGCGDDDKKKDKDGDEQKDKDGDEEKKDKDADDKRDKDAAKDDDGAEKAQEQAPGLGAAKQVGKVVGAEVS